MAATRLGIRGVRHAALRVVTWAAAALVVLLTTPAFAASQVPMCGVRAETIAAPPITRTAKEVPLSTGCEERGQNLLEQRGPKPAPAPPVSTDIVPRLPSIAYRFSPPVRTRIVLESLPGSALPGHSRGVERPPR